MVGVGIACVLWCVDGSNVAVTGGVHGVLLYSKVERTNGQVKTL